MSAEPRLNLRLVAWTSGRGPARCEFGCRETPVKRIVLDLEKNSREVVRVELDEFGGRQIVSARVWYRDTTGTLRPTPKGISIDIRRWPGLWHALEEAEELALAEGLIG